MISRGRERTWPPLCMIRRGSISGPLNFPGTSSEESLSTDCGALYAAGPRHKARVSGVIACGQAFPSVPVPQKLQGNSHPPPMLFEWDFITHSLSPKKMFQTKKFGSFKGFGQLTYKGHALIRHQGRRVQGRGNMNRIEPETWELPFFVTGMRGKLGNRVYYTRKGKIYSRRHVMPSNPRTGRQRERRSRFARAVRAWRGLDDDARAPWNRCARGMRMSGYNLFMRESMSREAGESCPALRPARASRLPRRAVRFVKRAIAGNSVMRLQSRDNARCPPARVAHYKISSVPSGGSFAGWS